MERFWKYKLDHVIFWTATVCFHMFTRLPLIEKAGVGQFLSEVMVRNALLALAIYINLLYLIPRFAQRKKWFAYALLLVFDLALYVCAKNFHDVLLYGSITDNPSRHIFFSNTFYNLSIAVFYMAFSIALQLSREWYEQRDLIQKIEVEKLNTELEYLKAQINPHFLFNSINTIFFQIDKNNTVARDTLSSFSEMLRYQLYECNGAEIPIEKEISYLRSYVDLQRLRKDENYQISFSHYKVEGFSIAPLLLVPFVENAFKHVSHFPNGNKVHIDIAIKEHIFRMRVFNTCDPFQKNSVDGNHGIGLKNVRRRLELLYKHRHSLRVVESVDHFEVNLELQIN